MDAIDDRAVVDLQVNASNAASFNLFRFILGILRYCVDLRVHHSLFDGGRLIMTQQKMQPTSNQHGLKSFSGYVLGFTLSLLLTLIAFMLAGWHVLSPLPLYFALVLLALIQLLVQVTFFLRLNAGAEGRWNLMAFLFTVLIVLVIVVGSLWIMFNLNYNMMH